MTKAEITALAERVEGLDRASNRVDVLVEIALFRPSDRYAAVRSNAAETKVIYTAEGGAEYAHWPQDWTVAVERRNTAAALRAIAASMEDELSP